MQQYKYVYNPLEDQFNLVAIPGVAQTQFEIVAPGNTGINQVGNWKFLIDANNNFCKYKCSALNTWKIVEINAFIQAP